MEIDRYSDLWTFFNEDYSNLPTEEKKDFEVPFGNSNETRFIFDKSQSFDDWLTLYIEEFRRQKSFDFPLKPQGTTVIVNDWTTRIFLGLLRDQDSQRMLEELDIETFPGANERLFLGGHYSPVRNLPSWSDLRDTEVPMPYLETRGDQSRAHFPRFTWEEMLNLCERFRNLGTIGNAHPMLDLYRKIDQLGKTIARQKQNLPNVLITGGIGNGKELCARAVQSLSGRLESRFLKMNCAAIPPNLAESEFFGHKEGAFTGAVADKKGVLSRCQGGTLQLDEIGKMRRDHQGILLRVLQEREYRPVGSTETMKADVLFIATTNDDLERGVEKGEFLKDLYSRFSLCVHVPPLYDRKSDVPLLVNHFLATKYQETLLNDYRFPLAVWCSQQVNGGFSVRDLDNEIQKHVIRSPAFDVRSEQIRTAIQELRQNGGTPPFTRNRIAGHLGFSRSTLSSEKWKPSVNKFVQQDLIKK